MTSASPVAETVAKTVLSSDDEPFLRRWIFAAAAILLIHAAVIFWLIHVRERNAAGEPPAAIMIELAPMDVAPPSDTLPEATPGPQMTEAQPETAEQQQTIQVPELPPVAKPNVVLTAPKPKPKPKKIVKEEPKAVVKPVHQPPAPRTSAPPRAAAASETASSRAPNAAAAAAWRSSWAATLSWAKHYPEAARARGEQGTVRLALVIDRGGHVVSARIIGSSGSSTLDQAALDMARHASGQPLPADMGSSVSLTVPIRYSIR
ncbi:MAG TPA: TonB family protein [Methylocella sp.]|nr:TonB family protein [Methylocella sp.]